MEKNNITPIINNEELNTSIGRHPSNYSDSPQSVEEGSISTELDSLNELGEYYVSLAKIEIYENTDNLNDENTKFNNDAIKKPQS